MVYRGPLGATEAHAHHAVQVIVARIIRGMALAPALRVLFLPVMVLLATLGVLVAASDLPEAAVGVVVFLAIAVSFAAERAVPYHELWNEPLDDRWRDVVHAVVNEGTLLASLAVLPSLAGHLRLADWWPASVVPRSGTGSYSARTGSTRRDAPACPRRGWWRVPRSPLAGTVQPRPGGARG